MKKLWTGSSQWERSTASLIRQPTSEPPSQSCITMTPADKACPREARYIKTPQQSAPFSSPSPFRSLAPFHAERKSRRFLVSRCPSDEIPTAHIASVSLLCLPYPSRILRPPVALYFPNLSSVSSSFAVAGNRSVRMLMRNISRRAASDDFICVLFSFLLVRFYFYSPGMAAFYASLHLTGGLLRTLRAIQTNPSL